MTDDIFKAADRSLADDLSPVWRMLAAGTGEPVVRALPEPGRPWQSVLAEGVTAAAASGTTLVIPVEKPLARAILSLLANRKWSMVKTPSVGKIQDELHRLGARVDSTFALWPSARTPRIAFPKGRTRLVRWAQRSGVLGGGGNRLWARTAARSPLFTPFAMSMAPGVALVVKVRRQTDA
jgi:hypothetical protein